MLLVFCCSFDRKDDGGRRSKNSGVAVAVAIKTENGPVRNAQVRASKRESGSCTQRHDGTHLEHFCKAGPVVCIAPSMSLSPVRSKENPSFCPVDMNMRMRGKDDAPARKKVAFWVSEGLSEHKSKGSQRHNSQWVEMSNIVRDPDRKLSQEVGGFRSYN